MGFSALSLFTHGWHHPGEVSVTTEEAPAISTVVEVRPTIRSAAAQEPPPGPAGEPVVLSAEELKPVVTGASGDPEGGAATAPKVLSAEDLKPVIVDAEEEQ